MKALAGHTKEVRSVAFTPDGRLISGGSDKKVVIWDLLGKRALHTISADCLVYVVAASPDCKHLAFAGKPVASGQTSNSVQLWTLNTPSCLRAFDWPSPTRPMRQGRPRPGSIWSMSFSFDGKLLAAAARRQGGGNILRGAGAHIWHVDAVSDPFVLPNDDVYSVAFAPTGYVLAAAHSSRIVVGAIKDRGSKFAYAWDKNHLKTFPIPAYWASSLAFATHNDLLVIAASSMLYTANVGDESKVRQLRTAFCGVSSIAISPDGTNLIVGGQPGGVEIYDLPTMALRMTLDLSIGKIHSLAFSPDGCTFAAGGDKGLLVCDVP